jgi:excisionase family DNA binding protein
MDKKITFEEMPTVIPVILDLIKEIKVLLTEKNTSSIDGLMSLEDVAELFNVSLPTVHSYVRKGILVKYKMGAKTYFKREEVLSTLFDSKSVA